MLSFLAESRASRPDVMEAALKCIQGKALVNSLNLSSGDAEFLVRLRIARSCGAAVIVTLFDEEGEAVTEERRNTVRSRAEKLLADCEFPPEDVIFAGE
jgi:5-methyltetrahydrofolate--homocysteine methyltransferase